MSTVGVIGLGAMGLGMAQSLRRAGHLPHVCDARPSVAQVFAQDGGTACPTPAALGRHCQVVVSVVVNAAQTEDAPAAPDEVVKQFREFIDNVNPEDFAS